MAISKTHSKKSPSQKPTSFYKSKPHGGALPTGGGESVGDQLQGGPQREQVFGRKNLSK
jgi:hypothetical protein